MNTTIEDPTTVRELTRYVEHEHPRLNTSYIGRLDQVLVTATPGRAEPPAPLQEILESRHFEIQDQQVTGRSRWIAIVNPADGRER